MRPLSSHADEMSRSRSASPVRTTVPKWNWDLKVVTQDGFELSEFDEDCINQAALEAAVLRKHAESKQKAEERAAKKRDDEEKEAQVVLEMVRKYLPTCQSVDWDVDGALTETGRAHYFYGARDEIGGEFDHEISIDLALRLEHKNPSDPQDEEDFDATIGFEYYESQVWDAGHNKVSFEFAKEKPDILHLGFGDWDELPITKEKFKEMMGELLEHICPDEFTFDCAFEAFRCHFDEMSEGEIDFAADTQANPDQGL